MTLPVTARSDAIGNDVAASFPYGFKVFAATHLEVKVTRALDGAVTTLTYPTHFTATNVGRAGGGNVVLTSVSGAWQNVDGTLKTGYAISSRRVVPLVQETDIRNQGDFFADIHEDAFDYLMMVDQQQQDAIGRSLKLDSAEDPADFDMTLPPLAQRALKVLAFDSVGNPLMAASGAVAFTPTTESFDGTGAQVAFVLSGAPSSASALVVRIDGVVQTPITDFTVSGVTLTFTTAPATGTGNIVVQNFGIAAVVSTVGVDNVTGLSASTGAAKVGFVQSGIGAVERNVQDHVREIVVNAKGFGSKFATTPAADVNLAITAVNAAGGGTVLIPEAFTAETAITMKSNVTLKGLGRGTVITSASNAGIIQGTTISGVCVRDLQILGTGAGAAQAGVSFIGVTDSLVHNVYVKDVGHDGIMLLTNCIGNTVSNCHVDNAGDDGINIGGGSGSSDNTVVGNVVENVTNDGIHVSAGSVRSSVIGNVVMACGQGIGLFQATRATISGNTIYNCTYGIHTPNTSCADIAITGNVIDTCSRGMFFNNAFTRFLIRGNVLRSCTVYGIVFSESTVTAHDTTISGNLISGGVTTAGIFLSGSKNVLIDGNSIVSMTGDGVALSSTTGFDTSNIVVSNNVIRDCGGEGIEVRTGAASEHITIIGNTLRDILGPASISYAGGPYFNISHNRCIESVTHGIMVAAASQRTGRGVIIGNTVVGGCATTGIRSTNYDYVLISGNSITDVDSTGIHAVSGFRVIVENNNTDETIVGGVQLVRNTTAVGNVGAGEDNLMTTDLPAGAFSVNGDGCRITAWGTTANNSNPKTVKLYFGSAILTTALTVSQAGKWYVEANVFRTGVDGQDYVAKLNEFGTTAQTDMENGALTEDDGAAITIKCTGTVTDGGGGINNNDIVQEGMIVERLGD